MTTCLAIAIYLNEFLWVFTLWVYSLLDFTELRGTAWARKIHNKSFT